MRRFDRFLIGILWINAIVIAALWFFDRFFRFNLTSKAHWKYLAEIQVAGTVDIKFYAFFAVFVIAGLIGLYFLIVPKKNIEMVQPYQPFEPQTITSQESVVTLQKPKETSFVPMRPPRINVGNIFIPTKQESLDINDTINAAPLQIVVSEFSMKIKDLITKIGFTTKDIREIEGVKLDFCAIGTDDTLIIGLLNGEKGEITASEQGESMWTLNGQSFKSPVAQMSTIVQKLQDLFDDVLEDGFQVNIVPFVFTEGTIINLPEIQSVWTTLGINVFSDLTSLEEFLNKNKPRELDEEEKSEFNAFSEFINTVAEHFNV